MDAAGRARVPGFVDPARGAIDAFAWGSVPEEVQVAVQVQHVPAVGGPRLGDGASEGASADSAEWLVGFDNLAGFCGARERLLDRGLCPELVQGPLLHLAGDLCP